MAFEPYLDTRFERYNQFQIILNRPHSRQCGRAFILQMTDYPPTTIRPTLKFIGSGVFGTAFGVEDPELTENNINVVIKLADSDHHENISEIRFGYIASNLVRDGITPHLPLYTICRVPPGADEVDAKNCNCNGAGQIHTGCNFQQTITNEHGNYMIFDGISHYALTRYNKRKNTKCLVSFSEKLDGSFKSFIDETIAYNAEHHIDNNGADNSMIMEILRLLSQTIFGLKAMKQTPNGIKLIKTK